MMSVAPFQLYVWPQRLLMLGPSYASAQHRHHAAQIAFGLDGPVIFENPHTELPNGPEISGPHSQMYESWFGMIDPPRDYSVYDMSWVGPAASLISTVGDLNRFYGLLLAGEIVSMSSLGQMQRTVPVISFEGKRIEYGLGLHKMDVPGQGTFWGHDGTVWGAGAISMTRADGKRQMSVMVNLMRWNKLDSSGNPERHPIDDALPALYQVAMCGSGGTL